ncbi:hypothetical protein PIROE2DRAFT_68642 [Piromyces sp. E2]|nr:hypothetical protein PIROE2DRAFT_68642 [Piromyces sp. E2]|eukprot:OUM68928.1 hypothetical protein PIROE2DRAFT_68642 [Piromyces sp. E2]
MVHRKLISLTLGLFLFTRNVRRVDATAATALGTCSDTTETSAKCGMAANTYCIDGTPLLYEGTADACTKPTMSQHDYFIFKDTGTANVFTKVEETGLDEESNYLVYQAGNQGTAGTVAQVTNRNLLFDTKLLVCGANNCAATTEAGLYFTENGLDSDSASNDPTKLRAVSCDGTKCEVAQVAGVFYINGRIYKCTVDFACSLKLSTSSNAGDIQFSSPNIILKTGAGTDTIFTNDLTGTKYRILDEDVGGNLINTTPGNALSADIFVKITKEYMVKVTPKTGYFLNGASDVSGLTKALIYCSGDEDITKCDVVAIAKAGYYAIGGGVTSSESTYIKCGDTACSEAKEEIYSSCQRTEGLPECDQVTNPEAVCREGAAEGEVCLYDGEFWESGKGICFPYRDRANADRFQYFNAAFKHVLPQSKNTADPLIYVCDAIPACGTPSGGCTDSSNVAATYCKESGGAIKRTVNSECVDYKNGLEEGEMLGCALLDHKLPTCLVSGANAQCMEEGYCIHATDNKLYGMKAAENGGTPTCTAVDVTEDNTIWYFDKQFRRIAEDDITEQTVIYTSYTCATASGDTWEKINQKEVGEMIRIAPNTLEMCMGEGETLPLMTTGGQAYHSFIPASTKFAGLGDGSTDYMIKLNKDHIVQVTGAVATLAEGSDIDDTTTNGIKCSNTADVYTSYTGGLITKKKSDGICEKLSRTDEVKAAVSYFDKDGKIPSSLENDVVAYAYMCDYDAEKVAGNCEVLKGYYTNGSKVMACNGVDGDTCIVADKGSCGTDGDGTLGTGGGKDGLCVGAETLALPTTPGYFAYKSPVANLVFGTAKDAYVVVRAGADFAGVATKIGTGSDPIYFVNELAPKIEGNTLSEPLIKCTLTTGTLSDCGGVPAGGTTAADPVKYYPDLINTKGLIKCTFSGSCERVTIVDDNFTTGDAACKQEAPTDATTLKYDTSSGHYFFDSGSNSWADLDTKTGYEILSAADAKKLFDLEQASLVKVTKQVIERVDVAAGYYPRPTTGLTKSLIQCTSTSPSDCTVVETAAKGYYLFGGDRHHYVECETDCEVKDIEYSSCAAGGELPTCNDSDCHNGPVGSVCLKTTGTALFIKGVDGTCSALTGLANSVHLFDANFKELTGDFDLSLVKSTYKCTNGGTVSLSELSGCSAAGQAIGGVIKTTATATVAEVSKTLPACTSTGSANVCSGADDDENNDGTHCIASDTGAIYKNSVVTGGTTSKGCELVVGTDAGAKYFAFDADGKRVDATGKVTGENANSVVATYLCTVAASPYGVSACILNGNQLPRCEAAAGAASRCYGNAPVGSVCVTANDALLLTESATSCVALQGLKETAYYFDAAFQKVSDATSPTIKYSYVCAGPASGIAALTDCHPLPLPSTASTDAPVLKMCTTDEDRTAVPLAVTDNAYHTFDLDGGSFPGGDGTISVKVGKDGSVTELPKDSTDSKLPTCNGSAARKRATDDCSTDGSSSAPICITDDPKPVIKKSGTGSCAAIKGPKNSSSILYYKSDNSDITSPTAASTDIAFAYECTYKNAAAAPATEDEADSCTQIKGYKVISSPANSALSCSGKAGKNCVIHALSSCQSTDVGKMGMDGGDPVICFSASNKKKMTDDDKAIGTVAFYTSEYSEWYGKYGMVLLKVSASTVESTETSAAGYYINENVPAKSLTNALIYCTDTTLGNCKLVNAAPGYYQSALTGYYIQCSGSTGCEKKKIEHASCGFKNALPECKETGPLDDRTCYEDVNDSYCLGADAKIYKNVVVTGAQASKSCALAVPADTSTSTVQFYFTADRKLNTATNPGSSVKSYYKCQSDAGVISNCAMEHEPYAKVCASATESTTAVCYEGATADKICINSSGYLMRSVPSAGTGEKKCVKMTFTTEQVIYLTNDFAVTTNAGSMAYTFRCKTTNKCTEEYQKAGGFVSGNKMCPGNRDDNGLIDITGAASYQPVKSNWDVPRWPLIIFIVPEKFGGASETTASSAFTSAYQCKHKKGSLSECVKITSPPGNLIFSQTTNFASRLYGVCKNDGSNENIGIANEQKYHTIDMEKSGDFPGVAGPGLATVHFGNDHAVLMSDRALLPECDSKEYSNRGCTSGDIDVPYCMVRHTLYQTEDKACRKVVGSKANEIVYQYYTSPDAQIDEDEVDLDTPLAFVYQCTLSTTDNTCRVVRGYVKVNGLLVHCNGWSDYCTIATLNAYDTKCDDQGDGILTGDGQAVSVDMSGAGSYMIGYQSQNIFGIPEGDFALVDITEDTVKLKSDKFIEYVYTNDYTVNDATCTDAQAKALNEFKLSDTGSYGIYSLNCVEGEDKTNLCTKIYGEPEEEEPQGTD